MHSLKNAQKKDSTFFKDCTFSFSLEKRCYLEKLFSLKFEQLLIIAPFKKCDISKKVVTWWMIWYVHSHRSDRYMCLFLWCTNNFTCTVSLEVIFLLKWSNQAVQKFLCHWFFRNAHDMATNEIILWTGNAWIWSFSTTPKAAKLTTHHHTTCTLYTITTNFVMERIVLVSFLPYGNGRWNELTLLVFPCNVSVQYE